MYPVTPTASVAVKLVIGTVSEEDDDGMVNAVTLGAVVSAATLSVAESLFEPLTLQ